MTDISQDSSLTVAHSVWARRSHVQNNTLMRRHEQRALGAVRASRCLLQLLEPDFSFNLIPGPFVAEVPVPEADIIRDNAHMWSACTNSMRQFRSFVFR